MIGCDGVVDYNMCFSSWVAIYALDEGKGKGVMETLIKQYYIFDHSK